MKYPDLVPKSLCKTPILVRIESEDIQYDGLPQRTIEKKLVCNFQDRAKNIFTDEKKMVQVSGTALFCGDIAEELPSISGGTVIVFGEERRIVDGMKARNPDGTVNFCRLEVM